MFCVLPKGACAWEWEADSYIYTQHATKESTCLPFGGERICFFLAQIVFWPDFDVDSTYIADSSNVVVVGTSTSC